ncbi:MAG: alpha/beta hydrolase [Verrucomicrobia bacterium]|nr:alpha/beta hydrolase [Verrucomicrobiota bacterium]
MNRLLNALLFSFILFVGIPLFSQSDDADAPFIQRKDVVYADLHGTGLLLDVFIPKEKTNGLGIVDVASGAWHSDRNKIRDHTLARIYHIHCARGYTVFAVRPGSKSRYTLMEMDSHLKTAIRWIKAQSSAYSIDPDRLGLTGASAGGHLALMTALKVEPGKPDAKRPEARHSTEVRAVGVFFPPTDLVDWDLGKKADPALVKSLLYLPGVKGQSDEDVLGLARKSSPLHQVMSVSTPFLIFHGDADKVVPLYHSNAFVDAMKKAGNAAELRVKAGGGHPWLTLPEEVKSLADWFDEKLAK